MCIVTGGTSGIGLATVRILLSHGHRVIILSRNPLKSTVVIQSLRHEFQDCHIDYIYVDYEDLASVKHAARQFLKKSPSLDILYVFDIP